MSRGAFFVSRGAFFLSRGAFFVSVSRGFFCLEGLIL